MFDVFRKKIIRSYRQEGCWGTAQAALRAIHQAVRRLSPDARRARRARDQAETEFDTRYGVKTAGMIVLAELAIDSGNWEHGVRYEPIDPGTFNEMMRAAGEIAAGRTFVDFGCGKGRAMLLASEHAFKKILGIEFSPQLADIARRNVLTYTNPAQVCRNLEVVLGDAAEFKIPDGPLVLFFFNPFDAKVMARVVHNVAASLEQLPRPVTVIYNTPEHAGLWDKVALLRKVAANSDYSIYHENYS